MKPTKKKNLLPSVKPVSEHFHVKFTSTVFPTDEDMKVWESLTPEQRQAVIRRDEEEAYQSGLAEPCTMDEIIAEAKAEMNSG